MVLANDDILLQWFKYSKHDILFLSVCFGENLIDDIITQIGFWVAKL